MKTSATVIITFTLLAVLLFVGNVSAEVLAESPHPYANNYDHTWSITDPTATQMRIHFQNITLAGGSDRIRLYDGHSGLPVTYWSTDNGNDIWSEWFTTNTIDVQLTTDSGSTAYGFLVDQKEVRTGATCPPTNPTALAESCHPYANNYDYTWTISNPGATQMRLHFQRITLSIGDDIGLYDINNTLLATYHSGDNGLNIWSQWYPTDTLKVRFTTGWTENNWGFIVDQMDSQPPASITNLHNTTYQPTSITWNWTDPSSSGYMYARVFIRRCVPGRCAQRSSVIHCDAPHLLYCIHHQNKYRGTCWGHQPDLGDQHCDNITASAHEHHEPRQHYLPEK